MASKWANTIEHDFEYEKDLKSDPVTMGRSLSASSENSESGKKKMVNLATVDVRSRSQVLETKKDEDYRRQFFYSMTQSSNMNYQSNEILPGNDQHLPQTVTNGDQQHATVHGQDNSSTSQILNGDIQLPDKDSLKGDSEVVVNESDRESRTFGTSTSSVESEEHPTHGGDTSNKENDFSAHRLGTSSSMTHEDILSKENDGRLTHVDGTLSKESDTSSTSEGHITSKESEGYHNNEGDLTGQNGSGTDYELGDDLKESTNGNSLVASDEVVGKLSEKEITETLSDTAATDGREPGVEGTVHMNYTSVVNEARFHLNETERVENGIPTNSKLPASGTKGHSIDIANSLNDSEERSGNSQPSSPTNPSSPHEARPLIPEFLWSPMHQRLLADVLFAIESDLHVWRRYDDV